MRRLLPLVQGYGRSYAIGAMRLALPGLRAGADGLVPSGGNLDPRLYQRLWRAACADAWSEAETLAGQADSLSAGYQAGRSLEAAIAELHRAIASAEAA